MVVVTAPKWVPVNRIEAVLAEKERWILEKQKLMQSRPAPREYGKEDRAALAAVVDARMAVWVRRTGLRPSAVHYRSMTTRWGSCNHRTGSINFAVQLVDQPAEFIDYVILHELCHLAVPNHGPEFKALLDKYMPDWRQRKARQRKGEKGAGEACEDM